MSKDQLRQPAGTPIGGQYASDPNASNAAPVSVDSATRVDYEQVVELAADRMAAIGSLSNVLRTRQAQAACRLLAADIRRQKPDVSVVTVMLYRQTHGHMTEGRLADSPAGASYDSRRALEVLQSTFDDGSSPLIESLPGLRYLYEGNSHDGGEYAAFAFDLDQGLSPGADVQPIISNRDVDELIDLWHYGRRD